MIIVLESIVIAQVSSMRAFLQLSDGVQAAGICWHGDPSAHVCHVSVSLGETDLLFVVLFSMLL